MSKRFWFASRLRSHRVHWAPQWVRKAILVATAAYALARAWQMLGHPVP